MKTSIKDIVIGAFAVVGFYVVVTGFNSPQAEPQVISATPESHQWEMIAVSNTDAVYAINKVTGEVRKYESFYTYKKKGRMGHYVVAKEYKE